MKTFAAPSLLAALVTPSPGTAQDDYPLRFFGIEPESFTGIIDTERPNFSTRPVPLFAGHLQVEGGLQFTRMEGDAEDFTLPLWLLRAGLAKNVELQVGWDGYSFSEMGEDSFAGANDITVALKTQFTEQTGAVPAIGLLGQLSLPTGSSETTSNALDPSLGVLWTYDLQSIWSLRMTSAFFNRALRPAWLSRWRADLAVTWSTSACLVIAAARRTSSIQPCNT